MNETTATPQADGVDEPFVPKLSAGATGRTPAPKLPASPAFLWLWHPERWTVLHGQVVPILHKFALSNGVCNVVVDRAGNIRAGVGLAQRRELGWREIPHDVDGPGTTYVRKVNGLPETYISKFERVFPGSDVIQSDAGAYVDWLLGLIAKGVITRCPPHVLASLGAKTRVLLEQAEDDRRTKPSAAAKVKRHAADLAAIDGQLDFEPAATSDASLQVGA